MMALRMLKFDADKGGGAGGGEPNADLTKAQADLKAANDKIAALELAAKKPDDKTQLDKEKEGDLIAKAAKERDDAAKKSSDIKAIESALKFNLGMETFLKDNKDIFPKEIGEIVKVAEKEVYDTAADKANAVKAAVIQSFFSIQSNLDLLTASQKDSVADFLKLTKNGRETKAPQLYDGIFEPALEMVKRVKKAEELGKARSGFATSDNVQDSYKQRLIEGSKKVFLKEKGTN